MSTIKVFIKQPGYEAFNGKLQAYEFVNGVSVEELPIRRALKIGATMFAVDENGVQISPTTYRREGAGSTPAPMLNSGGAPEPQASTSEPQKESEPAQSSPPTVPERAYAREELEALADKNGIHGLREIAEPLNVKGRAVQELIERILQAQADAIAAKAAAPSPDQLPAPLAMVAPNTEIGGSGVVEKAAS